MIDGIELYNEDCMDVMSRYPDNYFDLAVVDPPYGIGEDGGKNHSRGKLAKSKKYTPKDWDKKIPDSFFFKELSRVSHNQIIWGANHFIDNLCFNKSTSCWVVWDKLNGDSDFADCELAWTNFNSAVRKFSFRWQGMLQGNMKNKEERIHPTQKPVALYEWIFKKYAKKGFKILDTHLGSGSIAIALDRMNKIDKMGLSLVGCELDEEYFNNATKRIKQQTAQQTLF